ncbi:MAG: hypothetical protein KIT23_05660 [Sphingopyxis sp.]|nr:hypothetical protein [Sphingopyxis sp.]
MSLVEKIGWATLVAILLAASHYFRGPLAGLVPLAAPTLDQRSDAHG